MKKHLILLATLGALLNYRPGHAQANGAGAGGSSRVMVASVRTKPVSSRVSPELTSTKPGPRKGTKSATNATQKPVGHFWSKIMGICSEVHTAAKKKS